MIRYFHSAILVNSWRSKHERRLRSKRLSIRHGDGQLRNYRLRRAGQRLRREHQYADNEYPVAGHKLYGRAGYGNVVEYRDDYRQRAFVILSTDGLAIWL